MNRRNLILTVIAALVLAGGALAYALRPPANAALGQSIDMADLPGGAYTMGVALGQEHEQQAYPAHRVTVPHFRLARTTVTFDQYDDYARATGRPLPQDEGLGRGSRPVINVDRDEMLGFIAWLNAGTGRHFRLPSEAEWEYAARAGTTGDYFWGMRPAYDYANLSTNGGHDNFTTTAPVATFLPNGFGLYDMIGNVWQEVEDCRHPTLEAAPTDGRAWVDAPCDARMMRGGYYGSAKRGSRVTSRSAVAAEFRSMGLGFRLAETP